MTMRNADDRGWQLALGLIAAWRAASDARGRSALARRLAEAVTGDASMVEQAVFSLTALGNMFLELYADCSGYPVDSIIPGRRDSQARRPVRLADRVMWAARPPGEHGLRDG
jgi:hypothetical protein